MNEWKKVKIGDFLTEHRDDINLMTKISQRIKD